ncbi:MAG TPA: alpha/beta hydrolase [Dermatophilaceae bacterium]|nr:alpha/beta hydrolase [Dermatophilaceae bacterium]
MTQDASSVLLDGPWEHRFVPANGARFHLADIGEGPLVVLLHGFPQFWFTWRHQMLALASAGFRAVAVDLRGYGASDKPPRGYDTYTGCADTAAIIRALGEQEAVVVGQGLGGWITWSMPTLQAGVTRAIGSLSMPHPRVMRSASLSDRRQLAANSYILGLQVPFVPERAMTRDHQYVEEVLRAWAAPGGSYPTPADVERYAAAMALPFVAHTAAEHYRWLGRSQLRQDGPLFAHRLKPPIHVPVLHLQGGADGCVLPSVTSGSDQYVVSTYENYVVDDAGHFLTEEAPERVSSLLVDWVKRLA